MLPDPSFYSSPSSGTAASLFQFVEKVGPDAASSLQSPALCINEAVPRALQINDVQVVDRHLSFGFDIDVVTFNTRGGREAGSCP